MSAIADARMQRPQRWDAPFDAHMDDAQVEVLLAFPPFRDMDATRFPRRCALADILRNDTRLISCQAGDIILREGDYGSSAFTILTGSVRVMLESLSPDLLGRPQAQRMPWWTTVGKWWSRARHREVRHTAAAKPGVGSRGTSVNTRVFLQDVPGVLDTTRNLRLTAGELFGELAAISRTPRTATVIAEAQTQLLEIRWQGLRDIMRYAPEWKAYVNRLYRENSLQSHLRETPWLRDLSPQDVQRIADATTFETYGHFEWHAPYRAVTGQDAITRLEAEPLIESQGAPLQGVLLIRSGFARLCQDFGHGQQTVAYLGKGEVYGLAEAAHQWRTGQPTTQHFSLRAVGYVDVLRIPRDLVEELILPRLDRPQLEQLLARAALFQPKDRWLPHEPRPHDIDVGLLEFLLDHRTNNGAQTMLVDLNRCTRCDDCVRACAATHDNNPRFVRQGPQYANVMVTHACMHCIDPVCMIGCPTGAIGRDLASGTVLLNDATCIGCGTCANSCPYHNIILAEIRDPQGRSVRAEDTGVPIVRATKCDLCAEQPLGPACQRACPHDALVRMNMQDLPKLQAWLTR